RCAANRDRRGAPVRGRARPAATQPRSAVRRRRTSAGYDAVSLPTYCEPVFPTPPTAAPARIAYTPLRAAVPLRSTRSARECACVRLLPSASAGLGPQAAVGVA